MFNYVAIYAEVRDGKYFEWQRPVGNAHSSRRHALERALDFLRFHQKTSPYIAFIKLVALD